MMSRSRAMYAAFLTCCVAVHGCDDTGSRAVDPVPSDTLPSPDRGPLDASADALPPLDADSAMDLGPADAGVIDMAPVADAQLESDGAVEADADPLQRPLVGQSAFGPAARIERLSVPFDADTARRAGCLVRGEAAGSRLYNLLLLAGGGLDTQVRPDGIGRIDLVILLRARGWEPGIPVSALDAVDIDVLPGTQGPDLELLYRPDAFIDGDPANGPVTVFEQTFVDDGWLDSDRTSVTVPLSILNSPELPLTLDQAMLTGRIHAEGPGFRLIGGTIGGYVTVDRVLTLARSLRETCLAEDAPPFCALVEGQLDQSDDELVELMIGFIGGLEVRVADGRAEDCDMDAGEECNALGVCLIVQAGPVVVDGVAPAP